MRKIIFALMAVLATIAFAQNVDSLIDEAIRLHETRHLDPAYLERSYEILQSVIAADSNNLRALCEMAHVLFSRGDKMTDKKEKIECFKTGQALALKATRLDDQCVDGYFWHMALTGRIGQTKGVLNSLGLVPEIKKGINRVLELNPRHTGALDAKAMLYYELPKMFGGDLDLSLEALNRALAIDSNYTILYVDMAKVLIKKKEYEKARSFLNRLMTITSPTHEADFLLKDKPAGEQLMKEIEHISR